jgi:hypothetical protein
VIAFDFELAQLGFRIPADAFEDVLSARSQCGAVGTRRRPLRREDDWGTVLPMKSGRRIQDLDTTRWLAFTALLNTAAAALAEIQENEARLSTVV